jgi:hypothetical protein
VPPQVSKSPLFIHQGCEEAFGRSNPYQVLSIRIPPFKPTKVYLSEIPTEYTYTHPYIAALKMDEPVLTVESVYVVSRKKFVRAIPIGHCLDYEDGEYSLMYYIEGALGIE